MPRYNFVCEDGHEFELVAGFEDEEVECQGMVLVCLCNYPDIDTCYRDHPGPVCKKPAKRQAVYPDQYVSFKGPGFTKTVAPPASPDLPSTAGETTDIAKEMLDDFAGKQVEYDDKHRDRNSYETDFNVDLRK